MLTLWAAVVAERLGYHRDAALTIGRVVAGRTAARKAETLGLTAPGKSADKKPRPASRGREVTLMGVTFRVAKTGDGARAISRGVPIEPGSVRRYLESKFGEDLKPARAVMTALARRHPPEVLKRRAFALYEAFRPGIPKSARGWGARGTLDLERVRVLAREASRGSTR